MPTVIVGFHYAEVVYQKLFVFFFSFGNIKKQLNFSFGKIYHLKEFITKCKIYNDLTKSFDGKISNYKKIT